MKRMCLARTMMAVLFGLAAGNVAAHGDEDHSQDKKPVAAAAPATAITQRLADGSLFVPKTAQRQLAIRTALAEVRDLAGTVEMNGRVVADANAGGRVQASQNGRIEAGPGGLPTLGQRVVKGQVLAWLRPVAGSIERGNQQAALAELESQLAIAERKAARYAQLEGAVPQREIEAAQFDLDALKKRRAAVGGSLGGVEALAAPVSGVISMAGVVTGQVVESKDILFEIVDPARLAVEALAYDPTLVDGITLASAAFPGGALELQFVGGGRQLRNQALPLLFRIKAQNATVAVGQPLKVVARTARTVKGVTVPQAALVRNGAGEAVVWIHLGAERFAARKVSAQPLDATTMVVTAGLANGERVVIEGAGLLAQVR